MYLFIYLFTCIFLRFLPARRLTKEVGYIDWTYHTWSYIRRRWNALSSRVSYTTIFPYLLFTYECECIYSILLFLIFIRLEFRPAGKERKSSWLICPGISLVVSNNIEALSYGNALTGFETRLQGHPVDLFLKISVLQANFCWLGDWKNNISLEGRWKWCWEIDNSGCLEICSLE